MALQLFARRRDRYVLLQIRNALGRMNKHEKYFFFIIVMLVLSYVATASAVDIPGSDFSGDLETLGSIAQTTDKIAFGWIRPFAAGIFLIIGCVGLVRSHVLLLILGFGAALLILLTPKIVKEIGKKGGESILSRYEVRGEPHA
jgi:hypothetical protein